MLENLQPPRLNDKTEGIEVIIRIKPTTDERLDEQLKKCVFLSPSQENTIIVDTQNKKEYFSFDFIAPEQATQMDIYDKIGHPLLQQSFKVTLTKGYNCCIFAYGQTGAGKTYSILGNSNELIEDNLTESRGILPRLLEELFLIASEANYQYYEVKCSYLEIYNEQIIDLLNKEIKVYQIREDFKKGVYVEGLSEEKIESYSESLEYIMKGLKNRKIAATSMNSESSRSHTIFTVSLKINLVEEGVQKQRFSKIHIVDLAGSQRTKLAKVEGERLKEGCNINKSLHALGNVINSLVEAAKKKKYIPFRDSKLTFFLKDSLGGNSKTKLLANINPRKSYLGDTISTLMFAKRAKIIKVRVEANENIADNYQSLRNEIKKLREELAQTKFIRPNELKTEIRIDTQFPDTDRRDFTLSFRDKIGELSTMELDQNQERIFKILEENQMRFRSIVQINEQKLSKLISKTEKIDNSKVKQLFDSKKKLQKEVSHYVQIIANMKPFTKIFAENLDLKKKFKRLQQTGLENINTNLRQTAEIQNFKLRNSYLQSQNEQLSNQIEELKQTIEQNKVLLTNYSNHSPPSQVNLDESMQVLQKSNGKRNSITKRDESKQIINRQNKMLQEYETAIEEMKQSFVEYVNQIKQQYNELEKMYENEKKQKLEIRKLKRKQVSPNVQSLQNQNEYLKLNILELQTELKQLAEDYFKKQIQVKTYTEDIQQLKDKITSVQDRSEGISQQELAELLQKIKQIKFQAETERQQIQSELQAEYQRFNEVNSKLKRMIKQNCQLINKNQALINHNAILKRKMSEIVKLQYEQSTILAKESMCLTTLQDSTDQFFLEKTMNIDLIKEIDKLNAEKEVLLNRLQEAEQMNIDLTTRIEKSFNKNMSLQKQISKLKQENKHQIEQMRRMNIEIQSMQKILKEHDKKLHRLDKYQRQHQKILTEYGKDILEILEQYKINLMRIQALNHQNQKLRMQSQSKNYHTSLTKSMKALPTVKEINQSEILAKNYLSVKLDKTQDLKSTFLTYRRTGQQYYPKKRQSINNSNINKYVSAVQESSKPLQQKSKQLKQMMIAKREEKPIKIVKKK